MATDVPKIPRIDPKKPETWPDCACGAEGTYLVRVTNPRWENVRGEAQLGDYSGVGMSRLRRYYVVCDGCKVVGDVVDQIVGTSDGVSTYGGNTAHDE